MKEEWWKIGKLGNVERWFEEKIIDLKYKRRNRVYTIHGGDYKRKSDPNPHTNPVFDASPRPGDAWLVTISILHLILPPHQTWTPKNSKLGPKPLLFLLVAWS